MDKKRLIIVDDETGILGTYSKFFSKRGYSVSTAENGQTALAMLESEDFPVAIVDISMPVMDGITLAKKVKEMDLDTKIIILTGHGEKLDAIAAINSGACGWFEKNDIDMDVLFEYVSETYSSASIDYVAQILSAIPDEEFRK